MFDKVNGADGHVRAQIGNHSVEKTLRNSNVSFNCIGEVDLHRNLPTMQPDLKSDILNIVLLTLLDELTCKQFLHENPTH